MSVASITRNQATELLKFCKENRLEEFFFAKDHGAYFGATVGYKGEERFKRCIQYLKGMNPDVENKVGSHWYDKVTDKFGDNDLVFKLPVTWLNFFCKSPQMKKKQIFGVRISQSTVRLIQ